MAFLQQVMCPVNMAGTGDNQQWCYKNYDELHGVPRGTILGVNRNAVDRWKYSRGDTPELFCEPPFDVAGHTNHQIILEPNAKTVTSPNDATDDQRALGAMRCAPGTIPVWRGSTLMRTQGGKQQPVSVWQCEVTGGPRDKVRRHAYQYK
jgi:hypothetical protein